VQDLDALVRAAQRGDGLAMAELLDVLAPAVGRWCAPIALQDAQDAAQEALIAVFRGLSGLRDPVRRIRRRRAPSPAACRRTADRRRAAGAGVDKRGGAMTPTLAIPGPTTSERPPDPEPGMRDRALSVIASGLEADPRALTDQLLAYYAPHGDECGTNFLDGTEFEAAYTITAADLFAVTMLGVAISPSAARRLLHDTPESARIEACLEPTRLPLDVTLAEATPQLVRAMVALHDAIVAAIDPGPAPGLDAHVAATALCARKRPELFPVLDQLLCAGLGLPSPDSPVPSWLVLGSVLRDPHLQQGLARTFTAAHARERGTPVDDYPLRQLYVLICSRRFRLLGKRASHIR
jgi:hypothetical protein